MSSWQAQKEGTAVEELPPSDWLMGMPKGTFSWLLIDGEWSIPPWAVPLWAGGPGLYKEAAEGSRKQARRQCPLGFLFQAPAPASLDDGL